jgi:hypothetical protein
MKTKRLCETIQPGVLKDDKGKLHLYATGIDATVKADKTYYINPIGKIDDTKPATTRILGKRK